MKEQKFKEKVKKQLWFLNHRESEQLQKYLEELVESQDETQLNRPVHYANQFLQQHVFKKEEVSQKSLFILLVSLVTVYVILLGLFLFGFITSLTAVNYFINPQVSLSNVTVILILIGAILLIILSLFLIRKVTAFFTKKLLEYKFNRSND